MCVVTSEEDVGRRVPERGLQLESLVPVGMQAVVDEEVDPRVGEHPGQRLADVAENELVAGPQWLGHEPP
jgi:hypothetical protein